MHSDELNGSAVLAKLDGKDLYLSPAIAYAPFGMLPWERTGVPGLRLDKDGGAWIKTSLPARAASKITRKADLKLSPDGSLSGKLEVSFTGLEAINRRIAQRNNDDIARNKSLEEQIANLIPVGSEVNLTNQPDWMGPEAPLVATFSVKVPGWATLAGAGLWFRLGSSGLLRSTSSNTPPAPIRSISSIPLRQQTISISTFLPTGRYPFFLCRSS